MGSQALRYLYRWILFRRCIRFQEKDFASSAIVFAPHPDDETLGCGGTILLKKQAGSELRIVFMTDGSSSHASRMSRESLGEIRTQEAYSASLELGIAKEHVILLGLKDGELGQDRHRGEEMVRQILTCYHPAEIYLPFHREPPADHRAARQIVLAALGASQSPVTIYEYPIWFWQHWPWTDPPNPDQSLITRIKISMKQDAGKLLKDFRHGARIAPVLERKRLALARHHSQIRRINSDPEWKTLSDVSGGEFLACFFQEYEIFHRSYFGNSLKG